MMQPVSMQSDGTTVGQSVRQPTRKRSVDWTGYCPVWTSGLRQVWLGCFVPRERENHWPLCEQVGLHIIIRNLSFEP